MDKKTKEIMKNMDSNVKKKLEGRMKFFVNTWQEELDILNDFVREIYEFGMEVGEAKEKARAKGCCKDGKKKDCKCIRK